VIPHGIITAAIERLQSGSLTREQRRAAMLLGGGSVHHAPKKRLDLPGKTRAERRQSKAEARRSTRPLVAARAAGRCEVAALGGCRGALHWDHFFGRGKVPPSVELEWMLCEEHDHRKTENVPSRAWWLEVFKLHAASHGYQDALDRCEKSLALELAQHPEARASLGKERHHG
jgi:hypothetical protein